MHLIVIFLSIVHEVSFMMAMESNYSISVTILQSLPVAFGTEAAKWICVAAIDVTQLSIAGYLLGAGKPYYALALVGLILPQVFFQFKYFLKDPVKYDVKYQASAQPIPRAWIISNRPGNKSLSSATYQICQKQALDWKQKMQGSTLETLPTLALLL